MDTDTEFKLDRSTVCPLCPLVFQSSPCTQTITEAAVAHYQLTPTWIGWGLCEKHYSKFAFDKRKNVQKPGKPKDKQAAASSTSAADSDSKAEKKRKREDSTGAQPQIQDVEPTTTVETTEGQTPTITMAAETTTNPEEEIQNQSPESEEVSAESPEKETMAEGGASSSEPRRLVHVKDTRAKGKFVMEDIVDGHNLKLKVIGTLCSCFTEKNGTPRQGNLSPHSRATLTIREPRDNTAASLDTLEQFSHVWLIFLFHDNKNTVIRPKVHPPRLNGAKVGVFSTRSPHRPNPIGLSLVKLDRVVGNTIHLSGLDLIDGTPILDVKPYHPSDSVALAECRLPGWMSDAPIVRPLDVVFSDDSLAHLAAHSRWLKFYSDVESVKQAIEEVLRTDIRSVHMREKHETGVYGFCLDNLNVVFTVSESTATVVRVELWDNYGQLPKSAGAVAAARENGVRTALHH